MGASVSYNLAKKGLNVLTIERFGVNHQNGSSHGKSRIIRLAYYEDPRYVPLLKRAFDSWREIESKAGKKLLHKTGGLMMGRPDGELVTGVLLSAKTHALNHQVLSAKEAGEKFEAFNLRDDFEAIYEESAGVLSAEECVRALVGLGSEAGCEFRFSEQVTSWKGGIEGMEVETKGGTHRATKLVFCSGAWTGKLLGGLLPLQVERQVPLWFSPSGHDWFDSSKMPVFISEEEKGVFYYGTPDFGDGVKVARTHGGEETDPDKVNRNVTAEDVAPVEKFASERLRGLGPLASSVTCLYTNTPDYNFVIGAHPDDPRATIASACSGHGFKFGSVLGEVVADMVTEGKTHFDIGFLKPDRFRSSGS
jgi:sarcosine oxidase